MVNTLISIAGSISPNLQVQLLLTLFFTMVTSLILGMGSPTTANYIITSTIALPAILALNNLLPVSLPVLTDHMFVYYYGIVSVFTPTVSLSCFSATGI